MITNKTFMQIAYNISLESKAEKRKVGAIIVKDNNIIAVGYNGTPKGFDNECENKIYSDFIDFPNELKDFPFELKTKPEVLHAESNAIAKCARSVNSSEGAEIYTTTCPCLECSKMIIQAGIIKVYYSEEYKSQEGLELLKKAGIEVVKINLKQFEIPTIKVRDFSSDKLEELRNHLQDAFSYPMSKFKGILQQHSPIVTSNDKVISKPGVDYFVERNKKIEEFTKKQDEIEKLKSIAKQWINLSKSIEDLKQS